MVTFLLLLQMVLATAGSSNSSEVWNDGGTYVFWNWKAGTSVSGNTGGSGTAKTYTGSVNTDAGFSIIRYIVNNIAQGDTIDSVTIERHGAAAKEWDALKAFEKFNSSGETRKQSTIDAADKAMSTLVKGMKKTASGLYYTITKEAIQLKYLF